MATLKQIKGTSKASGKEFTGYVFQIGEFETPMFFLKKIERIYLLNQCKNEGIKYDGE